MIALITGASSGIGRETARCFAADHYDVVLTARSRDALDELAKELRSNFDITVHVIVADLAEPTGAARIVEELERQSLQVDFLINNAGFGTYGKFAENDLRQELAELNVNIIALTELTKRLLPAMIARGHGRILNVASTAAFQPGPLMAVYCASKAYVLSFSEALAYETRGTGVTVTCLCPGPTESNFGERAGFTISSIAHKQVPTSAEVAAFGYRALFEGTPVAIHGLINQAVAFSTRLAPRSVVAAIAGKILSTGSKTP